MKNTILFFVMLMTSSYVAKGCDICGCSSGGNFFGILPQYQAHFLGFRYKYSRFKSLHPDDGSYGSDYFNTTEIWGRYALTKRLHLYAILPFQFTKRIEGNSVNQIHEFGDASIIANYLIFDNSRSEGRVFKQTFQFGAGLKLPSGKNNLVQNFQRLPENLQPGSGTTDVILNAIYTNRFKNFGLNADLNFKINQENTKNYKQGDKIYASGRFFIWFRSKGISMLPHLGLDYESSNTDSKYNKPVEFTGGESLLSSLGIDAYVKNISVGCRVQNALYQHLNEGNTSGKWRFSAQVLYLF